MVNELFYLMFQKINFKTDVLSLYNKMCSLTVKKSVRYPS
jgi:hypothetical protein